MMVGFFWPKKKADLKLEAQEAILSSALDDMKALSSQIVEVKDKLEARANGALVRLRAGGPEDAVKPK